MRELRFEEAPDPGVRFRGSTRRNSVWESRRENLPDEVQEGVVYRNAGVRLRIASEIVDSDPGFQNGSLDKVDKERVKAAKRGSRQQREGKDNPGGSGTEDRRTRNRE